MKQVEEGSVSGRKVLIFPGLVAVRVACAAPFWYVIRNDLRLWAMVLFAIACLTDAIDGRLAKRLGVSGPIMAYWDAGADFLVVAAAFSAFVGKGMYPSWTLVLIGAMFLQFVVTSGISRPVYDPVGKYYGVFLFATVGATLAFPISVLHRAVPVGIVGATIVSLASRAVFLIQRRRHGP